MSDSERTGTDTPKKFSLPKPVVDGWNEILVFLKRIRESPAPYALAICCVIGPLLLGYAAPNLVANRLMPLDKKQVVDFVLPNIEADLEPTIKKNDAFNEKQVGLIQKQATLQRLKAAPGTALDLIEKANNEVMTADLQKASAEAEFKRAKGSQASDRTITQSKQIAEALTARYNYAAVSGVLYLVSAATLLLGGVIVARRSRTLLVGGIVGFFGLALFVTLKQTAYANAGWTFLEFLLDKADANGDVFTPLVNAYYDNAKSFKISSALKCIIDVNTFVGLLAVGVALLAFAVLSSPEDKPTVATLKERKADLQRMIVLSSTILVVATVASKVVMDGPLALLVASQADVLRPLANVLTSHLGITGTIALFAAAAPALAGWYWAVKRCRLDLAKAPADPKPDDTARREADMKEADKLEFALPATVGSIIAVLAPALTSPIFNSLKTLIDLIPSGKGAG